ncbi:DNA polymerase III subunit delta' [Methylocella sp.]|uniref:DNA polymerase III subunit delta' n=1 Tax=Methylocella sp. TaxID=1978226 RepID=UPI003783C29B
MAAKAAAPDEPAEADRFEDAPHPRHARALIGHAEAEAELLAACVSGRLPQAALIGGPQGVGKATLAWRLARFLLVHRDARAAQARHDLSTDPDHPAVRQALALSHPDLFLLRREWNDKTKRLASEIRVDDVRRMIHMFQQAASGDGWRVGLVDSAEDLNASGANALLKLIEEPPPRCMILIVAHRPGRVLPTIRSRCRKILLRPLGAAEVAQVLTSLGPPWSTTDAARREAAAARARGSIHGALRRLSEKSADFDARARRLLDALPRLDPRAVQMTADHVALRDHSEDYDALLEAVFDWLEDRLRAPAPQGARALAPYAEVWEKATEAARQTEALNLDRRPFVLSLFADLAAAARRAAA